MASFPCYSLLSSKPRSFSLPQSRSFYHRHASSVHAFRRSDFDSFARRVASGDLWKDAWRRANDGFELFVYETKKTAERVDRRYSFSTRLSAVAQSAVIRAKEIDRDLEITQSWRNFTFDFSRKWPLYRKQLNDVLDTPLGRAFATILFLWLALSGWLFQILIYATLILPFAAPILIGAAANNFVIKGSCPACKKQFMGYRAQTVHCTSCGNVVWKPQGDLFSRGNEGKSRSSKKSDPNIIDVEFEER